MSCEKPTHPSVNNKTIEEAQRASGEALKQAYVLRRAEHWERSCEDCIGIEDGHHYCLIHGIVIKNADIMRCDEFEGA